MPKCAFLSTDNLEDFFVYDDLVKPHLVNLGWEVEDVSWKSPQQDFDIYDVVVVRSTWDYQSDVKAFIKCLQKIEASSAILENPLDLMLWNISKDYLKDLHNKGIAILPSLWFEHFDMALAVDAFAHFACDEIVIKPLVSANADHTYRLCRDSLAQHEQTLTRIFKNRAGMIQAFEESIVNKGEYSLFFFNSEFSHAILKTPKKGDFRVQEEHGGELLSIQPEPRMLSFANSVLTALPDTTLFARIDIVDTQRAYEIIEVELIEPSLYFNMEEGSAKRFAEALTTRYFSYP